MRYSNRFFLYAPFALVVAFAAGVMLLWFRASGAWEKRIIALNGHEIAPGVTLSYSSETIGGFPFRVDTVFKNFRISIAGTGAWQSDEFAMHALTYGSGHAVFEAAGNQVFTWTGADGAPRRFAFIPGSIRASSILNGDALSHFDLVFVALDSPTLTIGRGEIHMRRNPSSDAVDIALSGEYIQSPHHKKPLLHFRLAARITPRTQLNSLLEGKTHWQDAAESWRNANGHVSVDAIDLDSDTGSGILSLDAQHRLFGYYNLAIEGRKTIGPTRSLY
ncbi:MAG TPA: DUF2125 domain-containing protein [Rhizomicrobium sp.]|nr:DUF2125 domain-containing protein [Rhizomicrobium sp.]